MNSRWKLAETYPLLSQYKFNGREFVKDMYLNQLVFFARNYDSVLGRWWSPDPVAHFAPDWTPCRFRFDNPMLYTDPFGLFESKEEARKYAKAQGIKTGFLRDNKIVENNDGTWSIENKKEHSSISNLGGDLGIVKGSMVAANDVMDSKITGSGNLITLQLNVFKQYRDGSTNQSELFNSLSLGNIGQSIGGLNLFKFGKPTTFTSNGWKIGDRMLKLFDKGNPKANWKQNSSFLRSEMSKGKPIFDSYRDVNGRQIPTGGFLNAERKLLEGRGWVYDSNLGAYILPK